MGPRCAQKTHATPNNLSNDTTGKAGRFEQILPRASLTLIEGATSFAVMGWRSVSCIPNLLSRGFGETCRVQRGSLLRHELGTPADWHGAISNARGSVCSGRLHQPTLEPAPEPRAASNLERRTVMACPPAG